MLSKEEHQKVTTSDGQTYILCERLDVFPDIGQELLSGAVISVRCPATEESARQWRKLYQEATKTTFSVRSTAGKKPKNAWVLHHKRLYCQHYGRKRGNGKTARDTGCKVILHMRVRKVTFEHSGHSGSRSKKPDAGYALKVQSNGEAHNHAVESAAALKFRRVSEATRERLVDLFRHHHSPSTAFETLKVELQAEHGERYPTVSADRAVLPDMGYVYRLHKKVLASEFGGLSPNTSIEDQLEVVQTDENIVTTSHNGEVIVAAVTPLMEPVHSLQEAGSGQWLEGWLTSLGDRPAPLTGAEVDASPIGAEAHDAVGAVSWEETISAVASIPKEIPEKASGDLRKQLEDSLAEFSQHILEQASKPGQLETWHRAFGAMTHKYQGMSTAARLSALHNFGAARRTSTSMRGRARVCRGRPANSRSVGEHCYAAVPKRRRAAPHSLA